MHAPWIRPDSTDDAEPRWGHADGQTERGYSELEPSMLDPGQRGKRMWSTDQPNDAPGGIARGVLEQIDGADRTVTQNELWPGFSGTAFAEHARFALSELRRDGNAVVVSAIGDETDPWSVAELEVFVNARWSYWASASPIPGGAAYENFEVVEPFRQGAAFRFRVEPLGAALTCSGCRFSTG